MSRPADKPIWWRPGMTPEETRRWEAAQRAADAAPEIPPGSDIALRLQEAFAGFPARVRERRAALPDSPQHAA